MSRKITWLHLSDLHARQRDGWDSRQIAEALVRDLKTMQQEYGLRPDFIFFTGDIAFGAAGQETLADQYHLVRGFLDRVRKAFEPEIPIRDVYLVPGNHDIDRNEITPEQTAWLRDPGRRLDEILATMRDGKKQWRNWLERMGAYKNFVTAYGLLHLKPDDPHLIWEDQREIHGVRVGIAGLNSAWSCADNEDKGRLWLGAEWQISQLKQRMGPVGFAFALLHHPSNWFTSHEDPAAMRRLRQEFQVVLHGHEHQEWVECDSEQHLVLSAGACYESSWMENGYSFGQLDLDRQSGAVWLRAWDKQGRGWVQRSIHNKTQNGVWSLPGLAWLKLAPPGTDGEEPECPLHPDELSVEPGESAEAHYTRKFCHRVIEQHDVLELFGCDIPRALQRHQLSVAYVSLNLATAEDEEDDYSEPEASEIIAHSTEGLLDFESEHHPGRRFLQTNAAIEIILDQVAADTGRLLIQGPAGAGKSTLLRWCAIHAARQMLGESLGDSVSEDATDQARLRTARAGWAESVDERRSWRRKVPFLVRLRDCPNGCLPPAVEWPRFLAKHLPNAPTDWITNLLDRGEGLVLFDGVDEIHRDKRAQLAAEIEELVRTYPACMYVVSTRPGAVEDGWLARLDFIEARVEPMNRRDREEFIDKWYRSAALELQRRPRPGEDLTRTAAGLKTELGDQPELALLATNPLLCAMICALYRDRQERLPETPAELCEALCQMLLHRRERESLGLSDDHFTTNWRALTYAQKKDLLADLAWAMVSQGESSMERVDAGMLVAEGLARTPGCKADEAEEVLQALVERSGMLRPSGSDRIDFLHNTLKEYLAAFRVVELGDHSLLADRADDPAWQPVILFALALASEAFNSSLIGPWLEQLKQEKKPRGRSKGAQLALANIKASQFFLVRCRASAKRLAPEYSQNIDNLLKTLLPPRTMQESEAIARLGSRILNYAEHNLNNPNWWWKQTCPMASRCLRLLRWIEGPKAKSLLTKITRLSGYSSQVTSEWLLARNELDAEGVFPWPFQGSVLDFKGTIINDLSPLTRLTSLQYLWLSKTLVFDLKPLTELTTLQCLYLDETRVIDLTPLAGLIALRTLDLSETMVSDLNPLAKLTALQSLNIIGTQVSDFSSLAELTALQSLSMGGFHMNDLSPLAELTTLQSLNVIRTRVSDLSPITKLTALQSLNVTATRVNNLSPLAKLTSLQSLHADRTKVSDLNPLAKLIALQSLNIARTQVSDLTPLARLARLQSLS